MKNKKNNRKSALFSEDALAQSMSSVSATEFTGLVPALGAQDDEAAKEMYRQLYGTIPEGDEESERRRTKRARDKAVDI